MVQKFSISGTLNNKMDHCHLHSDVSVVRTLKVSEMKSCETNNYPEGYIEYVYENVTAAFNDKKPRLSYEEFKKN
ncbi:hypothetical protein [Bartonella harrusi]|uniref:Uncharacterized protein n=1 Tax=Bartonella harrusi TaxID=2961895 RepID=A0ABY5EUJ4_9HYPH|nr:hypothetical protein [Bartonella harrusi]UTO29074.1 hypothetical protein NMK50_03695 [Bartonella harrusi]